MVGFEELGWVEFEWFWIWKGCGGEKRENRREMREEIGESREKILLVGLTCGQISKKNY